MITKSLFILLLIFPFTTQFLIAQCIIAERTSSSNITIHNECSYTLRVYANQRGVFVDHSEYYTPGESKNTRAYSSEDIIYKAGPYRIIYDYDLRSFLYDQVQLNMKVTGTGTAREVANDINKTMQDYLNSRGLSTLLKLYGFIDLDNENQNGERYLDRATRYVSNLIDQGVSRGYAVAIIAGSLKLLEALNNERQFDLANELDAMLVRLDTHAPQYVGFIDNSANYESGRRRLLITSRGPELGRLSLYTGVNFGVGLSSESANNQANNWSSAGYEPLPIKAKIALRIADSPSLYILGAFEKTSAMEIDKDVREQFPLSQLEVTYWGAGLGIYATTRRNKVSLYFEGGVGVGTPRLRFDNTGTEEPQFDMEDGLSNSSITPFAGVGVTYAPLKWATRMNIDAGARVWIDELEYKDSVDANLRAPLPQNILTLHIGLVYRLF